MPDRSYSLPKTVTGAANFPRSRLRAEEAHSDPRSSSAAPCVPKEVSVRSILMVAIASSVLLSACGSGDPEEETLGAFFSAVQTGDQPGVERVSLAEFDGSVESWEIIERGTESEGPFSLADLEAELENKRNEIRRQRQDTATFVSNNRDTYDSYTQQYAEDPSAPFQGELATFHEQLQEMQGLVAQLEVDAEQLALDVEGLKHAATLSLSTPVDENFEGRIKVKPLQVRINDGSGDQIYTVVLQRYELTDTRQNQPLRPRWIIAEIEPNG
jgi:hypothetical protein